MNVLLCVVCLCVGMCELEAQPDTHLQEDFDLASALRCSDNQKESLEPHLKGGNPHKLLGELRASWFRLSMGWCETSVHCWVLGMVQQPPPPKQFLTCYGMSGTWKFSRCLLCCGC